MAKVVGSTSHPSAIRELCFERPRAFVTEQRAHRKPTPANLHEFYTGEATLCLTASTSRSLPCPQNRRQQLLYSRAMVWSLAPRRKIKTMSASIHCRHILVSHEYEADDIRRKLEGGENFEEMARIFSKCPSSQQGGDLGKFPRGRMDENFEEAAFALKPGETSAAVRTRFGYHLIQRIG